MSRDTFMDALSGEDTDRIPLFIRDMTLGMDAADVDTTDVFGNAFNPELSAECIAAFQRMTGQDAVIGCTHCAAFLIEQFGGKMKYPRRGIPVPLNHPLEGVNEFSGLDAEPKGKMRSALESYAMVRRKLPDTAVVLNVTGPLTKAGVVAGVEYISMLMESDRDAFNELLALCFDNLSAVIDRASADNSCDAGLLASATDNPDLFGADVFGEIVIPEVRRYADAFHKKGLPVIFHPHGTFASDSIDLTDEILSAGCEGFHFPEANDPVKLKDKLGNRTCLLGGTDIVPALLNGPLDRVVSETEGFLETFSDCRYVFMPSCSLHRGVPLDNVRCMCETVRQF